MNIKTVILVIIISIIVGAAIFFVPKFLSQNPKSFSSTSAKSNLQNSQPTPTPLPTPNPVTIDEKSDLKDEINKLKIPDFSEDFSSLKKELN